MLFDRATKHDFKPELQLNPDTNLEVVEEMKLVGYQLRTDLKTISNTNYIVRRAWKRMWVVGRLKSMGANEADLLKSTESTSPQCAPVCYLSLEHPPHKTRKCTN